MELQPIEDPKTEAHLAGIAEDGIGLFLLERGSYRGAIVNATQLLNQARANHELGVLESFILGHAYVGCALLTANVKGHARVGLDLQCSGPVGRVSVEGSADGNVRGYLQDYPIPVEEPLESFDMAPFIGGGVLSVTKYTESAKHPFTGSVNLEYGNIAQDLAHYFLRSEQTPTAFNLSVQFDGDGRVIGAGGLMVQAFPGAEDDDSASLDSTIRSLPSIGTQLADGATPHGIAERELADFDPVALGRRPVRFFCSCSKERFSRYLAALPIDEIRDIRDNGPFPLKTTCHNCNSTYEFTPEELEELYQMAR